MATRQSKLHQTWKTRVVPPELAHYQAGWALHNPGLEHHLWDDDEARAFVKLHRPELLATFDDLPLGIMRADAVRYVWLLHTGGIYADLDIECTGPMDHLLERGAHLVLEDFGARRPTVTNALMASSPGHPLWAHALELLAQRARRLRGFDDLPPARQRGAVLWTTGPYLLTDALATYAGDEPVTVHAQAACNAVHWRAGTWWRSGRGA
jgi:mannosyltransferase OCH1-like enzyme